MNKNKKKPKIGQRDKRGIPWKKGYVVDKKTGNWCTCYVEGAPGDGHIPVFGVFE